MIKQKKVNLSIQKGARSCTILSYLGLVSDESRGYLKLCSILFNLCTSSISTLGASSVVYLDITPLQHGLELRIFVRDKS
jgi:hypothetical protein